MSEGGPPPEVGKFRLYDRIQPPLEAGNYRMAIKQDLFTKAEEKKNNIIATRDFKVEGPKYVV